MELKLTDYISTVKGFETLLNEFNSLQINDVTATYINNTSLPSIDPVKVLNQHRLEKASKLPNFKEYLAEGIDLSQQMQYCPVTESCVTAIHNKYTSYLRHQYKDLLKGISYDKKAKAFVINSAGEKIIDDNIIKLTDTQAQVYSLFKQIFDLILAKSDSPYHTLQKLLQDDVWGTNMNDPIPYFRENSVAKKIKYWMK